MVLKLSLVILLHDSKNNIRTPDSHATGRKHTHVSEAVSDAGRVGSVRRRGVKVEGRLEKYKTEKNSDLLLHLHRLAPRVDVSFKAARSAASFQGRPVWSSTCPKTQLSSSSGSAAVVRASGVTWREELKLTNQEARRRRYQTPDLPPRLCAASCTLKCEDGF